VQNLFLKQRRSAKADLYEPHRSGAML